MTRPIGGIEPRRVRGNCPKCGSILIATNTAVWCTFIGGGGQKACDFYLDLREYEDPIQSQNESQLAVTSQES